MQAQYISYLIVLMITITIIGLLITGFANTWQEWEQTQHYYQIINNIQRICDLFDTAMAENKSKIAYINMPETITIGFHPVQVNRVDLLTKDDHEDHLEIKIAPVIGSFYFKTRIRLADVGCAWEERGEWTFFTYTLSKSLLHAYADYDGTVFSMFLTIGVDVSMTNGSTLIIHVKFPSIVFSLTDTSRSVKDFRVSISIREYTSFKSAEKDLTGPQDIILKLVSEDLNVEQMLYIVHIPEGENIHIKVIATCISLEVSFD